MPLAALEIRAGHTMMEESFVLDEKKSLLKTSLREPWTTMKNINLGCLI